MWTFVTKLGLPLPPVPSPGEWPQVLVMSAKRGGEGLMA